MLDSMNAEKFNQHISSGQTFVVDFYADWCGACKTMLPVVDEISSSYADIPFFKVNIEDEPELAETAKIRAIPMLLIYTDGKMKDFVYGAATKEKIKQKLNMVVEK